MTMTDTVDIEAFLHGFKERPALALLSLAIWYVTQHTGTSSKFPITIPDRFKPLVAAVLGALAGVGDKLINASSWQEAAAVALYSSMGAVLFHAFGIKMALGKNDVGIPKAMKTDAAAPPEPKKRITIPPVTLVLLAALLGGCSAAQSRAAGPAILEIADAVDEHAANVLEFVGTILPNDDHRLAALRAARVSRDFSRFYALARPLVQGIASGGNDVPRDVASDLALGAAVATSIEQGMRAASGRNPDGSAKP
jgi:hypothetical protein